MAHSRADTAVRARDDVFLSHHLGEIYKTIGDRLRMFDKIAVMPGNAGD
jgi:hypothetical protein